ncbi:MAG: N-acetyltransferase, partial [Frankiales bacterium]|nr:N-acetyltransferase [Frankiales bacterium]
GFAYAATYRPRPAYLHTAEDSVYVDPAAAGRGIGTQLLDALVARCTAAGRRQLIAVVGDSANTASIRLHERSGFTTVGVLHDVGWKFGRWLDTVIMQVSLGDGAATPPGSGDATGGAKS